MMARNATDLGERQTAEALPYADWYAELGRTHRYADADFGYAERQTHVQTIGAYQHAQHLSPFSPQSWACFCG